MKLTQTELDQLHKIQPLLFFYASQLNHLVKGFDELDDFFELSYQNKITIRDAIYQDRAWIFEKFAKAYQEHFTDDDIEVILSWKNQIKDSFFVVKQLKKYAKFLSEKEEKAYGVEALHETFDELLHLPSWAETVLLPFKGKITYDGLILYKNVSFGASIRKSINHQLSMAEAKYGLITSLPYEEEEEDNEKLLAFYAKSEENRYYYADEIKEIIFKSESLKELYYREVAKSNAKKLSKSLRLAGLKSGYFAIIDEVIVASGATKKEVEKNIKAIVPKDRVGYVYIYQLKRRRGER